MPLAKSRKIHSRSGGGRLVVSEGIAPSAYLLPAESLETLYLDHEDDRFEVVIAKGTILSVVARDETDHPREGYSPNRLVPANGTNTPIGVAQYDGRRPFDKGTSYALGFITHGYLEYPLIDGLNDDIEPGDLIVPDSIGRPVKRTTENFEQVVGRVIEVEPYGAEFDYGLLQYMELPSDPGGLGELFPEGTRASTSVDERDAVRANLLFARLNAGSAETGQKVVGAFRVNLTL